jgi:polyisoprenoid-binding protein YceI
VARRTRVVVAQCRPAVQLILAVLAAARITPWSAIAEEHGIDTGRSTITLHVSKSGLFRAFADNHLIQAPVTEGSFDDGPNSRIQFVVDVRGLHVLDPGLSADQREQVQTRMLGPEVLDADRFPQIRFQSTSVERVKPDAWLVRGQLTLHGQTRAVTVKVTPGQGRYNGSTSLKQTDFGITPISIAGGTVTVKDELQIDADIRARTKPVTEP